MFDVETMRVGKTRRPIVVALLSFVTFGVYFVYWYYMVNKEMNEFDPAIRVNPTTAAAAVGLGYLFLGVVFLFGIVSAHRTAHRAKKMFGHHHSAADTSPLIATILYILGGVGFPMLALFYPAYLQSQLNHFWKEQLGAEVVEIRRAA